MDMKVKTKEIIKDLCMKAGSSHINSLSAFFFHEVPVPKELLHLKKDADH
ncbi:MAG: hypothetical protein HDR01_14515 [Lachnospiraceae bacterium]|nr:hypothetical protein [Lachnospiraceae bacterium]